MERVIKKNQSYSETHIECRRENLTSLHSTPSKMSAKKLNPLVADCWTVTERGVGGWIAGSFAALRF